MIYHAPRSTSARIGYHPGTRTIYICAVDHRNVCVCEQKIRVPLDPTPHMVFFGKPAQA